jgi:hypothetical protein
MDYELIYGKFLSKIDDPKLLTYDEETLYEILYDYLTSALANPDVRKLFKTLSVDDRVEKVVYTMNVSIDEYSDTNFILEIIAKGMVIQWMTQKLDTALSLATVIGGKEEKMIRNEYKNNMVRLKELKVELKKMIRDSNYIDNSYIGEV